MTLQDIHTLVDYNYWARDRMLEAVELLTTEQFLREVGGSFTSVRDTAAHMLAAETVWYLRWQGESPARLPPSDRFPDVASLRAEWTEHEVKVRAFVATLQEDDIARVYDYTLTTGPSGSSPLWQMFQHLANHGTYHRGQVTTLLRQLGATPPQSTDMIGFFRSRRYGRPAGGAS